MIKLEVGKTYVDGLGFKHRCISSHATDEDTFICEDVEKFYEAFKITGECLNPRKFDKHSLIAEHKEPVVHEAWVVWHTGCEFSGGTFCSLTRTEPNKGQTMNGCEIKHIEKITYTEGA